MFDFNQEPKKQPDATLSAHELGLKPMGDEEGAEEQQKRKSDLKKFQGYVRIGIQNMDKLKKIIDRGDRLFKGKDPKRGLEEMTDTPPVTKVNKLRRKIVAGVTQIYSRNPKFIGVPKHPIMVPEPAVPDPMTGMMVPPIDPETGQPKMKDISEDIALVVAAIMDQIFLESGFKAECKAVLLEAHHRPASILQVGYEYDPDNKIDDVYFRWRSFKRFIIDPDAQVYNGVVRKCRFQGIMWTMRREEAEAMGLNWSAMTDGSKEKMDNITEDDEKRDVYQVWSQETGQVAWISANAAKFAMEPTEWPWQIDGFPFEILKLTEDTDEQFSRPIILEAEGIQAEMDEQRETMQNKVVGCRTVTLYDPDVMSEQDIAAFAGRKKDGYKPVPGLSSRASPPMQVFNEDKLDAEFYSHYERNEREMDMIIGSSANEQLVMSGKTAREVDEVSRNQGVMTSGKADVLADMMNNAVRKAVQIMRQTYQEERVTKISTKEGSRYWVSWKGSDILGEVDIRVEVGSTQREDDEIRKQVALNMFQTLQNIPGINVKRLTNDLLRENGKHGVEEYWIDSQPMQQPMQTGQPQPPAPPQQVTPGTQPIDQAASLAGKMSPMV